jgi:hypothetical protein
VPPETVAVNVTAVPTVPVVGPPITTRSASGEIVIEADAVAVSGLPLEKVVVTTTVKVPFTLKV